MLQKIIALDRNKFLYSAMKIVKNREQAEDVLSDCILKALENKDKYHEGNFEGWFYTMLRNECINTLRFKQNKSYTDKFETLGYSDNYEAKQTLLEVQKALFEIDYKFGRKKVNPTSNLLILHVYGYKYDELARKFNVPLGRIKNRIHRNRKELTKRIKHFLH